MMWFCLDFQLYAVSHLSFPAIRPTLGDSLFFECAKNFLNVRHLHTLASNAIILSLALHKVIFFSCSLYHLISFHLQII